MDTVRAPALLRLADRESITEEIERLIASTLVYHESCKLSIRQEESARKLRRSVQKATETCSRMAFAHAGTMEAQDHGVSKKLFRLLKSICKKVLFWHATHFSPLRNINKD